MLIIKAAVLMQHKDSQKAAKNETEARQGVKEQPPRGPDQGPVGEWFRTSLLSWPKCGPQRIFNAIITTPNR